MTFLANYPLSISMTPGVPKVLSFLVRDETFLRPDLSSSYTFRLEIFNKDGKMVVLLENPEETKLDQGILEFTLSAQDGLDMILPGGGSAGNFKYRVLVSGTSSVEEVANGYIFCGETVYNPLSTPSSSTEVLPDGTIYTTVPTVMEEDVWYALSNYFRMVVSGQGIVSIDTRDLTGTVSVNVERFIADGLVNQEWRPDLIGQNALRINIIQGEFIIKYYP